MRFDITAGASVLWIPLTLCLLTSGLVLGDDDSEAQAWPSWRGPHDNGSASTAKPPVTWSETVNLAWKIALPGKGHSTPIIWGDQVLLTSAIPFGEHQEPVRNMAEGAHDNFPVEQDHRFVVLAFDAKTGHRIWQKEVAKEFPHEGGHYTGSLASHSMVTDGKRIFAYFGSRGLFALDMKGGMDWKRTFGRMDTRHAHGEGSSPALRDGVLVVNWDHEKQSQLIALNAETGEEIWQADRDEMTSWSTPLIVPHEGRFQVIVSATKRVRSYDLRTGRLIWECAGLARNVVASPVFVDGTVIVGNSYDKQAMMGIRLQGARGDITNKEQVIWSMNRMTPYVPSPLIYDGALYFLRHNQAVLSCVDPLTGKVLRGPYRLAGLREIFASPVAADGRIYIVSRNGGTLVLSHDAQPRVLAINELDDQFSASPALVGEALYLRGEKYLYCIGTP